MKFANSDNKCSGLMNSDTILGGKVATQSKIMSDFLRNARSNLT